MMEGDSGRHEQMRISTMFQGVPMFVALGVWHGGRYDGKDLPDGKRRRPIYGRVPLGDLSIITGVVEERESYNHLGLWVQRLEAPTGTFVELPMTAWYPGLEEDYDGVNNETLAKHCRAAKPSKGHIRFELNGIDGLYAEITGWSVNVYGVVRYGVRSPLIFDNRRVIAISSDVSMSSTAINVMNARGQRIVCPPNRWSFSDEWKPHLELDEDN